ncbi:TetR/AcrR family transcriptional regulator [Nocardia stercoris]|uniref:TetR/AcrR family transcriptional regulator n=1 Tax=Nocardia stercoris TaxID=2483361 RepID=A0A3M2LBL2_9NOCA|nr:TetR/AcrR family transcriptional regulator [Nocardia stercoris]RMI34911.1 TetR/AcrR family transcriptional regulator [Nocardia stercoris]
MSEAQAVTVADRLLGAAQKLLARKGIRATTMIEVAEEAGVSRAWLYRQFPDKTALLGAAIVRLTDAYWTDAHAELGTLPTLADQLTAGVRIGRGAYDDPGTLLLRLRMAEPEEFALCVGAGVSGLVPDLAGFWRRYVDAALERGEIHPNHDPAEVAEWIARLMISLGTVPGDTFDPEDVSSVRRHVRRYILPSLSADPAR